MELSDRSELLAPAPAPALTLVVAVAVVEVEVVAKTARRDPWESRRHCPDGWSGYGMNGGAVVGMRSSVPSVDILDWR